MIYRVMPFVLFFCLSFSFLSVFAGEEEDLQAEKKIFGKDFAYIHDISNFANIVGHYLKKQITD